MATGWEFAVVKHVMMQLHYNLLKLISDVNLSDCRSTAALEESYEKTMQHCVHVADQNSTQTPILDILKDWMLIACTLQVVLTQGRRKAPSTACRS